jgi:hypothetical protein
VQIGDAARIVAVLDDKSDPFSTRVAAFDPTTRRIAWSREGTSWFDDPIWIVPAGDEIVVITGSGQVEARDAMSGAVRRTGHVEYRVEKVRLLPDARTLALDDVRGPYWRLDLASLTVSMTGESMTFGPLLSFPCSAAAPPVLREAAAGAEWVHVCPTKDGVVGLFVRGQSYTLIAAGGDPLAVRWSSPTALDSQHDGFIFPMAVAGDLVLMNERCDAGRCVVARDVRAGGVVWSGARDDDVPEIVFDYGGALYLQTSTLTGYTFEIRRRDTGEVIGRWPE